MHTRIRRPPACTTRDALQPWQIRRLRRRPPGPASNPRIQAPVSSAQSRHSAAPCRWNHAGLILLVLAAAAPLAGQTDDAPADAGGDQEWLQPAQVDELNDYLDAHPSNPDGTLLDFAGMVELSRALAEPRDRVQWLIIRLRRFTECSQIELVGDVEQRAWDRIVAWKQQVSDENEVDSAAIRDEWGRTRKRLCGNGPDLHEITDPQDLAEALDEFASDNGEEALQSLDPDEKFILLARGVHPADLGRPDRRPVNEDQETGWDRPRLVVAALAGTRGSRLPTMLSLIDLEQSLREADADGPYDTVSPRVTDTFRIVGALLGRALGVDGQDRDIAEDDDPVSWASLAAELEGEHLWTWAALARILQAATMESPDSNILGQGKQQWEKVRAFRREWNHILSESGNVNAVPPDPWPHASEWLNRLDGGELEAEWQLPLSHDFRDRYRVKRTQHQRACLAAIQQGDYERAFRLMQLAKAAEAGFDLAADQTATIQSIKDWFANIRDTERPEDFHLYLEMLEVGVADYCAIAIGVDGDLGSPLASYRATKHYRKSDPADILREALQDIGFNAQPLRFGRFLIAPDHSIRDEKQMRDCENVMRNCMPADKGWFLYLPTAAALLNESPWKRDPTLRYWYQIAKPDTQGRRIDILRKQSGPNRWECRKLGKAPPPISRVDQMYAITLGTTFPDLGISEDQEMDFGRFLKLLAASKRENKTGADRVLPFVLYARD